MVYEGGSERGDGEGCFLERETRVGPAPEIQEIDFFFKQGGETETNLNKALGERCWTR